MIDESELPARRAREGEELLYDFFKHMTSLSLVTLGGVLTISQIPDMEIRPSRSAWSCSCSPPPECRASPGWTRS